MKFRCINHPDEAAVWGCERCKTTYCSPCAKRQSFQLGSLAVCPADGEPLAEIEPELDGEDGGAVSVLANALAFPFVTTAKYAAFGAMLLGSLAFVFLGSLAPTLLFLFTIGYAENVLAHTMEGRPGAPYWQDIDGWSSVFAPFLRAIVSLGFGFIPMIWAIWTLQAQGVVIALAIVGVIYAPMAWLAVAATRSYLAILPHIVLAAIARVGGAYWLAVIVLPVGFVLVQSVAGSLQSVGGRFFGGLASSGILVVAATTAARLLGLIYRCSRKELEW